MKFRVLLAGRAASDVDEILTCIAERSPQGAAAWSKRWDEITAQLSDRADQNGLAPEGLQYDIEIRHLIFSTRSGQPYRVLFTMGDDAAVVLHVRGPGQDILSLDELDLPR
jgi:plasmid stabilization system protein ParE